jgi:hypothetical protein
MEAIFTTVRLQIGQAVTKSQCENAEITPKLIGKHQRQPLKGVTVHFRTRLGSFSDLFLWAALYASFSSRHANPEFLRKRSRIGLRTR